MYKCLKLIVLSTFNAMLVLSLTDIVKNYSVLAHADIITEVAHTEMCSNCAPDRPSEWVSAIWYVCVRCTGTVGRQHTPRLITHGEHRSLRVSMKYRCRGHEINTFLSFSFMDSGHYKFNPTCCRMSIFRFVVVVVVVVVVVENFLLGIKYPYHLDVERCTWRQSGVWHLDSVRYMCCVLHYIHTHLMITYYDPIHLLFCTPSSNVSSPIYWNRSMYWWFR